MINGITVILTITGLFFFFGTTIGILRFPDFYTRMHAAGKGDILSSFLILTSLALYNMQHFSLNDILVSIKILMIYVFVFLTSPTATHAIIDAGSESGIIPWKKKETPEDK